MVQQLLMNRRLLCRISIALALMSVVPLASVPAQEPMRFLEACGNQHPCLLYMPHLTLEPGQARIIEPQGVVTRITPLNDGITQYELNLRGRLQGGPESRHNVLLKAYTGGINCSAFGQTAIPMTGYSQEGHPLVLTSKGELEITNAESLFLGCRECLRLLESDTMEPVLAFATHA